MTTHALYAQWLNLVALIARQAGDILKHYWGNLPGWQEKEFAGDLVTEADKESEKMIIQSLQHFFPTHQILAEESGFSSHQSDYRWVIDPLDGTTNYAHQYPMFAVSIGLMYQKEPVLGVIYNPITDEMYQAAQGLGATLNQRAIAVSSTNELKNSLLATGFAYDRRENPDTNYLEFCHFTHLSHGVRRAGAASLDLAYVACGRLDGYWERGLKPWDMAAGMILVKEAGGQISDYHLDPIDLNSGRILATNGHLQQTMSSELIQLKQKNLKAFM